MHACPPPHTHTYPPLLTFPSAGVWGLQPQEYSLQVDLEVHNGNQKHCVGLFFFQRSCRAVLQT